MVNGTIAVSIGFVATCRGLVLCGLQIRQSWAHVQDVHDPTITTQEANLYAIYLQHVQWNYFVGM